MAQINTATSAWTGTLKDGSGKLSLPKADTTFNYDFGSRFETGNTTNPEELIAGALTACFSMYLTALFSNEGLTGTHVTSTAEVTLDNEQSPPKITTIELSVEATAGTLTNERFHELLEKTENECPIKNLLQGATISVKSSKLISA